MRLAGRGPPFKKPAMLRGLLCLSQPQSFQFCKQCITFKCDGFHFSDGIGCDLFGDNHPLPNYCTLAFEFRETRLAVLITTIRLGRFFANREYLEIKPQLIQRCTYRLLIEHGFYLGCLRFGTWVICCRTIGAGVFQVLGPVECFANSKFFGGVLTTRRRFIARARRFAKTSQRISPRIRALLLRLARPMIEDRQMDRRLRRAFSERLLYFLSRWIQAVYSGHQSARL